MKDFLEKYKAVKIETSQDEGKLTLETAKKRILKLLVINIKNTKDDSWDLANRMNKLMIDTDSNTIFSLRLGGKRIVRYSLELLDKEQKMNFFADFYNSVSNGEFDEEIVSFLAKEFDKANQRKKEANERRRLKKQEAREKRMEMARRLAEEQQKRAEELREQNKENTEKFLNEWLPHAPTMSSSL